LLTHEPALRPAPGRQPPRFETTSVIFIPLIFFDKQDAVSYEATAYRTPLEIRKGREIKDFRGHKKSARGDGSGCKGLTAWTFDPPPPPRRRDPIRRPRAPAALKRGRRDTDDACDWIAEYPRTRRRRRRRAPTRGRARAYGGYRSARHIRHRSPSSTSE
jgi:hypothetical protein